MIMKLSMASGFIPFKALYMLGPKYEIIQQTIRRMQKESILEEYHNKDIWIIGLKDFDKNSPAYQRYFPPMLLRYYRMYGYTDCKRVKYSHKKEEQIRVIRNSEIYMFLYRLGLNIMTGYKVSINSGKEEIKNSYYNSRELRASREIDGEIDENEKLQTSRFNGMLTTDGGTYVMFNMGNTFYQFSYSGEKKVEMHLKTLTAQKSILPLDGCILLTSSLNTCRDMLDPPTKKKHISIYNLERVYSHVYVLPYSLEGQKMLQIMSMPQWAEKIRQAILSPDLRSGVHGTVACDGQNKNQYHFIFCNPDLKRLKMFLGAAETDSDDASRFYIYCFSHQKSLLQDIDNPKIIIRSINIDHYYEHIMRDSPHYIPEKSGKEQKS